VVNSASMQLCAVELAALLAQNLGLRADSTGARPKTNRHFVTVFQVVDRCASCRLYAVGSVDGMSCLFACLFDDELPLSSMPRRTS
jgi:hypothetical protein